MLVEGLELGNKLGLLDGEEVGGELSDKEGLELGAKLFVGLSVGTLLG